VLLAGCLCALWCGGVKAAEHRGVWSSCKMCSRHEVVGRGKRSLWKVGRGFVCGEECINEGLSVEVREVV